MLVLGIETSTCIGSVALINDKGLLAEYRINIGMVHSERLMIAIDRLLSDTGTGLEKLTSIAVSIGPGSFAGLRIGLATAKGIQAASGIPIAPVPTLDAMAQSLKFAGRQICAIIDARKKEVYAAIYESSNNSGIRRITDYMTDKPEKVLAHISSETIFIGDGAEPYRNLIIDRLGEQALFAPKGFSPSAVTVAELGADMIRNGVRHEEALIPLYLRNPEAETKYGEGIGWAANRA
ncbi:MAG: tRNA (adenosine(37)-N6)-threonylcarbamoyltransferase complex dimerization subunit type 1 TsaB [Nitrospirae bacterium]|nr:tRNA (adenosine(37)-N6)-threonylcarbamoyltransferase complex dimerization subunit type 1 TsaB [Nitrospirota bacterium]